MGRRQKIKQGGSKPPLPGPLQDDPPVSPRTFTPESMIHPVARIKQSQSTDPAAAGYVKNNPTPTEVYARQNFKGLCLECQMMFATWKEPHGIGIPCHQRSNAHHSFHDLEHCWCPLCKMLLRDVFKYDKEVLQALRLPGNYTMSSHVRLYEHDRHTHCYYIELVYDFDGMRLLPSFMMFVAGEI